VIRATNWSSLLSLPSTKQGLESTYGAAAQVFRGAGLPLRQPTGSRCAEPREADKSCEWGATTLVWRSQSTIIRQIVKDPTLNRQDCFAGR
jgi:hypothetical protein